MAYNNSTYLKTILQNAGSGSQREKSVVMYHVGRSGSTVVGDLLNQNANIFWDSEIFMPDRNLAVVRPASNTIFRYPKLLIGTRRMRTSRPIYGFEIKLDQFHRVKRSIPQFVADMSDLGFGYSILLQRRNRLRVIVSDLVARNRGQWHRTKQEASLSKAVTIDVNAIPMGANFRKASLPLLEHLAEIDREFAQLESLLEGTPVLKLFYEDDIMNNPEIAYQKICSFLDLEPTPVKVHLARTNPQPIRELVSNYDEVAEALEGSPYAWMLDE